MFKFFVLLLATLSAMVMLGIGLSADKPSRKFGPEWTKDKDGGNYRRKMEIEVTHSVGGNVGGYTIPLEKDSIGISETDETHSFTVGSEQGHFRVEKNEKGKVTELSARFRECLYFDLDGDGMIDCFCDNRRVNRIPTIIFEGRFVQVEDSIDGFGAQEGKKPTARGIGRKVKYVFDKGVWKEVPVK